jgi:predicted nucleic-acid-binding protein
LCDLVWVLERLYGYNLQQRQQTVGSLLTFAGLRFEALPVVLSAYKGWKKHGGNWTDHLVSAQMRSLGCGVVLTLDKAASRAATHRMV